ncbi:MAG: hypothetical protein V1644_01185 [Candidatus Micrarchaeota archaeon]
MAITKAEHKGTYFHHEIQRNGQKITILGITHGNTDILPIGRITAKIIKEHAAANPEAQIYGEMANSSFLPRHLIKQAKGLENKRALQKSIIPLFVNKLRRLPYKIRTQFKRYFLELIGKPRIKNKDLFNVDKPSLRYNIRPHEPFYWKKELNPAEIDTGEKFIMSYRSAKMAQKLDEAPHEQVLAVVGAGHSALIAKFLENPKLRERYIRYFEHRAPEIARNYNENL